MKLFIDCYVFTPTQSTGYLSIMDNMQVDLSFLDAQSFDFDRFISEPITLFSFNCVLMSNNNPDVQMIEFYDDSQVAIYIQENFSPDSIQTIVKSNNEESKEMCPYFRIIMDGYSDTTSINFKLRSFFVKIGVCAISDRCTKALVVGLWNLVNMDSPISMPSCFTTTTVDDLDFCIEEDIDLSCLQICCKPVDSEVHNLCDIAGMSIPVFLPSDVQWNIVSYLQSPTAELIHQEMDRITRQWDVRLFPMFQQREPRIPYHIASYFNASTVQSTIENATKPYLVPNASGTKSSAVPEWMKNL